MLKREKGFSLIELLIVVAIIGMLAAIAIPNLLNALQRGKQKRTMGDIRWHQAGRQGGCVRRLGFLGVFMSDHYYHILANNTF